MSNGESTKGPISIGCTVGAIPGCVLLLYVLVSRSGDEQREFGFAFGVAFWAIVAIFVGAAVGGWIGAFFDARRRAGEKTS